MSIKELLQIKSIDTTRINCIALIDLDAPTDQSIPQLVYGQTTSKADIIITDSLALSCLLLLLLLINSFDFSYNQDSEKCYSSNKTSHHHAKEKKSTIGCRRKKSNTTIPNGGAKRSKTEEENPTEYRNGILHGLRVIL